MILGVLLIVEIQADLYSLLAAHPLKPLVSVPQEVQKQCKRAWQASTLRVASFLIESKILPIDSSQFMLGSLILLPTISLYVLDFWFFIL